VLLSARTDLRPRSFVRSRCSGGPRVSPFSACTLCSGSAAPDRRLKNLGDRTGWLCRHLNRDEHFTGAPDLARPISPPLTLADETVRSDSVTGHLIDQSWSRMAFAHADVLAVETRVLSTVRTTVAGIAAGMAALVALMVMSLMLGITEMG
jgi:hypothetical protein